MTMKASFKGKFDVDKSGGTASLAFNAGNVKLRATMTDAALVAGPSLNGLSLAVEKPGFFIIDYNVPKKDVRFQFMNTVRIAEKPLNLTYIHMRRDNRTIVDASLVVDPANKLSANYTVGTKNCKLKYTYVHGGMATFEPCYDLSKNMWDFAVSRKLYGGDSLKATYRTSSKMLGLEWSRNSKTTGSFKVCASMNLAEELKTPKLTAETTWNLEI
ncbi:PREDICTED: outer envelope pore protein 24A, chloroplastic-like [Camelina sativa]|uniref:Outer envelope pore protein 24A, chloroplastic-like n=1 Tax=Camelina sativa TaxID=90675 RepID=A0ABM0X150_CAMSA|nr:PREDICTED: outer envelope pore protein 24A, chloroplastic-like [Camelina sativa]